ncbi:MAG: transposase [Tolypothrix brevis GSE-NOS-MK-07-07A]|jgi:putative transposase|nr:transposase [Tolypothrix brevis GSE-NOS-MK-07-07A]
MSRKPRNLQPGFSYHITIRCNNREFRLTRLECREVLLYAIKKAQEKYGFKLYALCIMSNHVHYLHFPCTTRRFTQNYALAKLVHCHVL